MKKLLAVIGFVVLTAVSAMAQDMMAGGKIGLSNTNYNMTVSESDFDATLSQNLLSFGAFFDATYIRAGIDYTMSIGDMKASGDLSESASVDTTYIDLTLIGKYPVDLGNGAKIWGGLGIMYSLNLTAEADGTDIKDDSELSDFFGLLAIGCDYDLGSVILTPAVTFGYNFTSQPFKEETSGVDYMGYIYGISFGAAVKI